MAQTHSRRPLTAEARVQSWVSPCGICSGQSGTGTGFSPSTSVFPCQFNSTGAPLNGKTKKLITFITGLHNKHQGCGASESICCGALHTHTQTNKTPINSVFSAASLHQCSILTFRSSITDAIWSWHLITPLKVTFLISPPKGQQHSPRQQGAKHPTESRINMNYESPWRLKISYIRVTQSIGCDAQCVLRTSENLSPIWIEFCSKQMTPSVAYCVSVANLCSSIRPSQWEEFCVSANIQLTTPKI
jgi:hypothetical protein